MLTENKVNVMLLQHINQNLHIHSVLLVLQQLLHPEHNVKNFIAT